MIAEAMPDWMQNDIELVAKAHLEQHLPWKVEVRRKPVQLIVFEVFTREMNKEIYLGCFSLDEEGSEDADTFFKEVAERIRADVRKKYFDMWATYKDKSFD